MTIKQQGGIFGRNPTFNTINVNDEIAANSLDVSGSASIDGPALIGTGTAEAGLHVDQNVGGIFTRFKRLSSQYIDTIMTSGVSQLYAYGKTFQIGTGNDYQVVVRQNNVSRMTFETDGNVTIENGNLILGTSGKGIDFSATSNSSGTTTSELFDDYEEGAWTPVLTASGGGASAVSFTGSYVKVGRMVHFSCHMGDSGSNAFGSGTLTIAGLPYSVGNSADEQSASAVLTRGISSPITSKLLMAFPDTTSVKLYWSGTDGSSLNALDASHVTSGSTVFFRISGFYFVD